MRSQDHTDELARFFNKFASLTRDGYVNLIVPCLPEEPITRSLGNHTDAFAPFFIASTSPTDMGSFADVG
jgi:hypothetical protein